MIKGTIFVFKTKKIFQVYRLHGYQLILFNKTAIRVLVVYRRASGMFEKLLILDTANVIDNIYSEIFRKVNKAESLLATSETRLRSIPLDLSRSNKYETILSKSRPLLVQCLRFDLHNYGESWIACVFASVSGG